MWRTLTGRLSTQPFLPAFGKSSGALRQHKHGSNTMNESTKECGANSLSAVPADEQEHVEGGGATMRYYTDTSSMQAFYESVVEIATFHRSLFPK